MGKSCGGVTDLQHDLVVYPRLVSSLSLNRRESQNKTDTFPLRVKTNTVNICPVRSPVSATVSLYFFCHHIDFFVEFTSTFLTSFLSTFLSTFFSGLMSGLSGFMSGFLSGS